MNAFYEHHQDSVAMHYALPRRQIAATSVQSRRQFRRGFMVEVAAATPWNRSSPRAASRHGADGRLKHGLVSG
jgi:hypothetical protein